MSTETPSTNTQSLVEQDTKDLQMIWDSSPRYFPPPSPSRLIPDSPACEIHLITTEVKKEVREHSADLFKQTGHKLVGAVKDGVDGPIGPRRILAQIAGSQETRSTWVITNRTVRKGLNVAIWPCINPQTLLSTAQCLP